ncbi:WSCD family member AAEL009094 [Epargyreus clarus]|uniref:WSCD family member AAEL009094 n=1 Tax=Epargyreus clarus TaxID=520877 RepID=UPI003C2C919B
MSRKVIFLFCALSIFSYFGVIFMVISPLSTTFYSRKYVESYPLRPPSVQWCKQQRWRSPAARGAVALVSFPGSGNTWLRYLLQQLTGIVTGSIYMDYGLRLHGFPAENVSDGSVLVVKTHESPPIEPGRFKAAVLLIRNPRDAILADYNRLHKGHIGTAPKSAFRKRSAERRSTDWSNYVATQLAAWESLHKQWLTQFPGPIHIVFYEVLVNDTRHTLQGILSFLNQTATEDEMNCTLANREGIYRRKKKYNNFDPFTRSMYDELNTVRNKVLKIVLRYQKQHSNVQKSSR